MGKNDGSLLKKALFFALLHPLKGAALLKKALFFALLHCFLLDV
jgi:hypothetical protein